MSGFWRCINKKWDSTRLILESSVALGWCRAFWMLLGLFWGNMDRFLLWPIVPLLRGGKAIYRFRQLSSLVVDAKRDLMPSKDTFCAFSAGLKECVSGCDSRKRDTCLRHYPCHSQTVIADATPFATLFPTPSRASPTGLFAAVFGQTRPKRFDGPSNVLRCPGPGFARL